MTATCSRSASSRSGPGRVSSSPAGRVVPLSVREFGLLVALARRAGRDRPAARTCTRWSGARRLRDGDRSIDVYVHKLRVEARGRAAGVAFIHTHVGFGYRFSPGAFTCFSHRGHRPVTGWAASARDEVGPDALRRVLDAPIRMITTLALCGALAFGVAACGDDDEEPTAPASTGSEQASGERST